jgi:hypothetical protein
VEIIAQWLDDLDDLVCALPLLWERVRRGMLRFALAAAISLPLVEYLASRWAITLAAMALLIVVAWLLALAGSTARHFPRLST